MFAVDDDSNTETEIGKRVRELRDARGWSVSRLSQKSGVSPGYLTQIESGRRPKVGATILIQLAQAFRVSVDELLGYDVSALPEEGLRPRDVDQLARVESRLDTVAEKLTELMEVLAAGREARAEELEKADESQSPRRATRPRSDDPGRRKAK